VVLAHPDHRIAALACIPVAAFAGYWLLRRRGVEVAGSAALSSAG